MRPLNDAELEAFSARADHTNHACDSFCCPHCLESSTLPGVGVAPVVVECPLCSHEFVAWQDTEIVFRSARPPLETTAAD